MTTTSNKPNTWFWIIGVLALLWNLMGASTYIMEAYDMVPKAEKLQAFYESRPAWATAGYALAVFAGVLGCLLLLMKRKLAKTVFLISLIGVVMQQAHIFFISDIVLVLETYEIILTITVLIVAILLVWYSTLCIKKGWIK